MSPRPVTLDTHSRIDQQRFALEEAERRGKPDSLAAAQSRLGETLFSLLDGPEHALQHRLVADRSSGQHLHLILRLCASEPSLLPRHPALGWHLQLLTPPAPNQHLALQPYITLTLQLGDAQAASPELLRDGQLQLLFMASSPRDVEPVLDYEAEEERLLDELAPFVQERRLLFRVAEEGSLAELRRRLQRRAYDIVHLSGHGILTDDGPRLLMEDENGSLAEVSPVQLLEAFRAGLAMPRLVVLSSCHTAEQRSNLPSLAADLLQGGLSCVIGWTRPVNDAVATRAAAQLYTHLCSGAAPAQALARTRQHLHEEDLKKAFDGSQPTGAWATLQLLTTQPAGFALSLDTPPVSEAPPSSDSVYEVLDGSMRVLKRGFIGRRRDLQALGRVLRHGVWGALGETERPVAGAAVIGMKGQGKSSLVGRAVDRHIQDTGELSMVVLHGVLDEFRVAEAFRAKASQLHDAPTQSLLMDGSLPLMLRLELILSHHWRERRMVIILDDFEQNLDIPGEGEAKLHPLAASLLQVLVPACLNGQPKLLMTSTAQFALPASLQGALAKLALGALDGASVRKLWSRSQLPQILPSDDWAELSQRLGRNARILEWARQLFDGKTPEEVREIAAQVGEQLPVWTDFAPDKAQQDALVALFLRHMALEQARAKVGPEALTFIERARVYEEPVSAEALMGLTEGLSVSLEHHLVALANLGLLEVGSAEGLVVYRVSPLVLEKFDTPDGERWHAVAARYWWQAAKRGSGWHAPSLLQAWRHAIQAKQQAQADEVTDILGPWLDRMGHFEEFLRMCNQHMAAFPGSIAGLTWAGYALHRSGQSQNGLLLLKRGVELSPALPGDLERSTRARDIRARLLHALGALTEARQQLESLITAEEQAHPEGSHQLASLLHALSGVVSDQGDLRTARALLERSLPITRRVLGTEEHVHFSDSLHELAGVLSAQGELRDARTLMERALAIKKRVLGTEVHPDVATSLHALANILRAQGELPAARSLLERALAIYGMVLGTEMHPHVCASLDSLASVLRGQGELSSARDRLKRALDIKKKLLGTEEHADVASLLHNLAGVLKEQGDLPAARALLERSLAIFQKTLGTEEHSSVAASLQALASVRSAQGELSAARALLERSLAIHKTVLGTEEHADFSALLHELAGVLSAQGELPAARALLERSLAIKQKVLGTEVHPNVATSLHALASVLSAQGELPAARALLERALAIEKKVFGTEEHPTFAASLHELSVVLRGLGELPTARALLERALAIYKTALGTEEHPLFAASLHELAVVLKAQSELPAARALLERAITIHRIVLGTEEHPSFAASLHALAGVLGAQGELPAARALLERSLAIKEKVLGTEEHLDVSASLQALALMLRAQGELPAARTLLERALAIQAKVLATDKHPSVATCLLSLADCLCALGLLDEGEAACLKALDIYERVYGTREHHMVAEAEFILSMVLMSRGRPQEAQPLLQHAISVLRAQAPNHPLLRQLSKSTSSRMIDPNQLAQTALEVRKEGSALPEEFLADLQALRSAGEPYDQVADFLEQLARGGALPPVPSNLPEDVEEWVASVHQAAEEKLGEK